MRGAFHTTSVSWYESDFPGSEPGGVCPRVCLYPLFKELASFPAYKTNSNVQNYIHLLQGDTLGLWKEEIGPNCRDHHPRCKEEPCSVSEGREDVGQGFGESELNKPLDEGCEGPRQVTNRPGEDFGGNYPGNAVETK